jgi:hypothetical protein
MGFIDEAQLLIQAKRFEKSGYGDYLAHLLE